MKSLQVTFSNRHKISNDRTLAISKYRYDFYNENFSLMKRELDKVTSNINEHFSIDVTFEVQDMLSYSLLCEFLSYIFIENSTYRRVITINAVIDEEGLLNEACKQGANLLSDALKEILLDVKLFRINEMNCALKPVQLTGTKLFDELVNISIECDRQSPNYRYDPVLVELKKQPIGNLDEVNECRKRLRKTLTNESYFKAFTTSEWQIFEEDGTNVEIIIFQDEDIELYNQYDEANRFMKSRVDQMLFNYWMQS